jgi:anti-sigma-K factor RskA
MNIGNYITSGILQDYCLGVLTIEEEKKVEIMCRDYPAVAKELHLLRQTLEKYATTNSVLLRDELRMKVWKAVKKLWDENPL